jgi:exopolyphosphatase/guanosine-5'-triphosphate,3'-diphosphate pyrophosphatase
MVTSACRLAVLLRLAVLFNRSRTDGATAPVELSANKDSLTVAAPVAWLEDNPLTLADLQLEAEFLGAAGLQMKLDRRG